MLTRRGAMSLLPGALGGVTRQAAGQPACGLSLVLEGTGAARGRVMVFGQAFRPGDVPAGAELAATIGGRAEPVQIDVTSRHPDGSARLAVMALAVPALAEGARIGLSLAAAPRGNAPALAIEALLTGRQALVEIGTGATLWRADLLGGLVRAMKENPWQAGPLAAQARMSFAVPAAAVGGVASLRLVADAALRADGTLWVDAWFRNDAAMRPNGGEAAYSARLLMDGRPALVATIARHHQYTGWGRLLGSGRDGPATAPARIRHDAGHLADSGAVARYGVATGVDASILGAMAAAMAAPGWETPLGPRGITRDMRQTGARADIGPATMPQAVWLITGDRRAADFAQGQAEAAGSIPWHFWDAANGNWIDPRRWPRLWTDGRGGPAPGGLAQPIAADTGWVTDCAHQPDLSFVPFLLTGRRSFLDNLQAQASWCIISQWPAAASRGAAGGAGPGEGLNVVRGNQVRGAAWSLRQLENAAWASPERDPNLAWLRAAVAGNWGWIRSQIPTWTRLQGEAHGRIPGEYGTAGVMPPWQQDQFASTAVAAARRGSGDARAVLEWMANFLVGRFTAGARGFTPHDGCAYLIATGAPDVPQSWAEIGRATRAAGLSNGAGWSKSEGDYAQWALQAVAGLADALDLPPARQAHAWLLGAGAPFLRPQDFRRDPILNIVPREGAASPRCGR